MPSLANPTTATPLFFSRADGVFTLELTVSDGQASTTDTMQVWVGDTNLPPIADAGPNRVVAVGSSALLDGTGSRDPEGTALSFRWTIRTTPDGSDARLGNDTSSSASLFVDVPGRYVVELVVSDGVSFSEPDLVEVAATDGGGGGGPYDVFDAQQVYLFGTVLEGSCSSDAIAHWMDPNHAGVGFGCYTNEDRAIVVPGTGRLIFTDSTDDTLREFRCDDCEDFNELPGPRRYPRNVFANDVMVPTPGCTSRGVGLSEFRVWPDGSVIHRCREAGASWYDETGATVASAEVIVALGNNGRVLVRDGSSGPLSVLDVATSSVTAVDRAGVGPVLTSRARAPSGFWVVFTASRDRPELWSIEEDGTTNLVTTYAPQPPELRFAGHARLDGARHLFHFARTDASPFHDVIVRRSPSGQSTVVYTEATSPAVKIHISSLVTGP